MLSEPYDSASAVLLGDGIDCLEGEHRPAARRDRQDRQGEQDGPVPQVHRQRLHAAAGEGRHLGRARLLRRPRAAAVRQPGPALRLRRGGLPALHRQHDDAGQGRAPVRGRDDDELRLRPRGGGHHRGVRELHLAGEGRQGGPREEGPEARRQPADLPARGRREAAAPVPGAVAEGRADDAGGDGEGRRRRERDAAAVAAQTTAAAPLALPRPGPAVADRLLRDPAGEPAQRVAAERRPGDGLLVHVGVQRLHERDLGLLDAVPALDRLRGDGDRSCA